MEKLQLNRITFMASFAYAARQMPTCRDWMMELLAFIAFAPDDEDVVCVCGTCPKPEAKVFN